MHICHIIPWSNILVEDCGCLIIVVWDEANLYSRDSKVCSISCACKHVYDYNTIIYKICCSTAFLVYPIGEGGEANASHRPSSGSVPKGKCVQPTIFCVCVQGFPLKIWKVPSTIRCGTGTSLVMITHWMEVRRRWWGGGQWCTV